MKSQLLALVLCATAVIGKDLAAQASAPVVHSAGHHDAGHHVFGHGLHGDLGSHSDSAIVASGAHKVGGHLSHGAHSSQGGQQAHYVGKKLFSRNRGFGYEKSFTFDHEKGGHGVSADKAALGSQFAALDAAVQHNNGDFGKFGQAAALDAFARGRFGKHVYYGNGDHGPTSPPVFGQTYTPVPGFGFGYSPIHGYSY